MNLATPAAPGLILAALLSLPTGCGNDKDRAGAEGDLCERAVHHTVFAPMPPGAREQIGEGERTIMRVSMEVSVARCRAEGLSQAQADCIFAVDDIDELLRLGECPAIRDNKPSWLILPPIELVDDIERRRQERTGESAGEPPADTNTE